MRKASVLNINDPDMLRHAYEPQNSEQKLRERRKLV